MGNFNNLQTQNYENQKPDAFAVVAVYWLNSSIQSVQGDRKGFRCR